MANSLPTLSASQDPQPYGDAAHPVRQDPTQYIIAVHWGDEGTGGGPGGPGFGRMSWVFPDFIAPTTPYPIGTDNVIIWSASGDANPLDSVMGVGAGHAYNISITAEQMDGKYIFDIATFELQVLAWKGRLNVRDQITRGVLFTTPEFEVTANIGAPAMFGPWDFSGITLDGLALSIDLEITSMVNPPNTHAFVEGDARGTMEITLAGI